MAEDMQAESRGQGGLPWHLRLNALLGRARTCFGTGICNCANAALSRRRHGAGKPGQPFRGRRDHKVTFERTDEERWRCVARSACAGFVAWWPEERQLQCSRAFGIREAHRSALVVLCSRALAPARPNARAKRTAEADAGWRRKDDNHFDLESPDGGCRSGSGG